MTDPKAAWGEARSKTVVWYDPLRTVAAGAHMNGLTYLQSIRDGVFPPPPMAALFGMRMREVSPGRAVFDCQPDESAYNPLGIVHGGLVCTLADSVAGCAVHTTLDAGFLFTSIDINLSYLRPVTSDSGVLRAVGVVTKPGRRVAFASVEIFDGAEKLVAMATSSCLVMERPPA